MKNFPNTEMPTIIPDKGIKRPKTETDVNYLENRSIDKAIRQKLRNKDMYETDLHKIYNLIVGQTNEKFQEKAAYDTTLQAVNTGRDPIGYLMILKKLCFSKKSEQHPICSIWLATRWLYNTIQHANVNTTNYLFRFCNSQKVNEAWNVSLTTRRVKWHGMNIL